MEEVRPSRIAFVAGLIAIGLWGFIARDFVAIWAPGIEPASLRPPMVIACSSVSILSGLGLLWPSRAMLAARILLAFLLLWMLWCKGAALLHAPAAMASWESLGETVVIASAAWALAIPDDEKGPRLLYGLALIAFGAAHLAYVGMTASLVPGWLPAHPLWVYFTAATYIAAGVALVAGRLARAAAALSALQMALFGALVWLPRIAGGARDADTLNETVISFALAVSGWVIATMLQPSRPTETPPA